MLGHDLEMSCAIFQGSRFRIDGEINKKHALQIILSYTIVILYWPQANGNGPVLVSSIPGL